MSPGGLPGGKEGGERMQEIRENDPVAAEEQNRPTSSPGGKVSGAITEEERWRLVDLINRHFGRDRR